MTRGELGLDVGRAMIPVEEAFAAWRKDSNYVAAYKALEDEFSRAAATIEARALAEIPIKAPSG